MELPDWTRGMVLLGRDAVGELQIVGLDAAGRISAFVIDSRDAWGQMLSIGNAELAVRLGSHVGYDRRGAVTFMEDWEDGRGLWTVIDGELGTLAVLDPALPLAGGYCLKMSGGAAGGGTTTIILERGLYPTGRLGMEFSFSLGTAAAYVTGGFAYQDQTGTWSAYARYKQSTDELEIQVDGGGWEAVEDVAHASLGAKSYNTLKLVIDTSTHKYERALFNAQEVPLTDYGYNFLGAGTGWAIQMKIEAKSRAAQNDVIYVDDVILTLAEPAN